MNCYGYAIILIIYTEYETDIINIFTELNVVCNWGYVSGAWVRSTLYCKRTDFFMFNTFWCYRSLAICFVSKYYGRWEISHIQGIGYCIYILNDNQTVLM